MFLLACHDKGTGSAEYQVALAKETPLAVFGVFARAGDVVTVGGIFCSVGEGIDRAGSEIDKSFLTSFASS